MPFVISRNYLDNNDSRRYLIREVGQAHSEARKVSEVRANGVVFRESDEIEFGFGCGVVAEAQEAQYWEEASDAPRESGLTRIRFNGHAFHQEDHTETLQGVARLVLKSRGGMFAKLNAQS